MVKDNEAEILLALYKIQDRLQELVELSTVVNAEVLEASKQRMLGKSTLRKKIYELCNGKRSVGQIAAETSKSIQQISQNVALLQNAGLIREARGGGKEKYYVRAR
ncbi:MAG: helix-turn-helix transcriptional regulator [Candidatus Aenigmatarchaeota archaeon]|nr:MAG: helix-turn-helix transcriptional regulator [Candidatus Aenigmarchaeota archaeon]